MAERKKPRVREVILVEGKYDQNTLSQLVEATILPTNGFRIFKDKARADLLRRLARERGVVIFTDADGGGLVIRNHLRGILPPDRVKEAYIPDLPGKERRKRVPGKEGKLGVEGMPPEILLSALRRCGALVEDTQTDAFSAQTARFPAQNAVLSPQNAVFPVQNPDLPPENPISAAETGANRGQTGAKCVQTVDKPAQSVDEPSPPFTKATLFSLGLTGTPSAAQRRKQLQKALSLPENLSTPALLKVLNILSTPEEIAELLRQI